MEHEQDDSRFLLLLEAYYPFTPTHDSVYKIFCNKMQKKPSVRKTVKRVGR